MKSKSKLGWILRAGASLVAISAVTPAMAQEADDGVSDEIVVTATGRTAAIQDVPIAVTAIGHETLEDAGVNTLIDLRQVTPNLRIGSGQSQTSGTSASIRGLGTGSDNPGFEAAVGIFIDGVYRARAGAAVNDLPDIERVEILRGPQGTLYGKNTSAGAISVVTASPDFEWGAWAEGTVGDLNERALTFGANMPASENFAFRFDGSLRNRDGYIDAVNIHEDINSTDRWSARLQALWDISPDASLRVIVDGSATDEACCAAVTLADTSVVHALNGSFPFSWAMNLTQPGSVLTPSLPVAVAANPEARQTSVTRGHAYSENADDFGVSAQLDWAVGNVNITSISAFRDWDSIRDQDIDFSAMDRSYRDGLEIGVESMTQEIRVQGEAGRVNWLIGGFFGDETVEQTDRIQYGEQADTYIDRLLGFFDFSALGLPSNGGVGDANGPLPGSGAGVFNCTPGAPGTSTCALDYAMAAFAAYSGAANTAVPGTTAALVNAIGAFSTDMVLGGLPGGAGQQNDEWTIDTQSLAFFTHNEISLSDDLMLTVGARWTREEKDMRASIDANQPACAAIRDNTDAVYAALLVRALGPNPAIATLADGFPGALLLSCNPAVNDVQDGNYARSLENDAVSGTVSLSYHLNEDTMVYGGYSRGYKSGGFNIDRSGMTIFPWTVADPSTLSPYAQTVIAALGLPTTFGAANLEFDPETVDAYELGVKTDVLGGMGTLNAAAFYQQLHDYQLNAFNGFNYITRNVPEVVSQGVEIELFVRPTDELSFTMGALYLDVFYDSTVAFGSNPTDVVHSGDPLTQSPEWTLTGSVNYERPVFNGLTMGAYLNGRYVTDYRLQTLSRNPLTDQEAFAIFDARLGFSSEDDRWGVDVFVRNLTDEYYSIGAFAVPEQSLYLGATDSVEGVFAAYPNEPRTVGVSLRTRW